MKKIAPKNVVNLYALTSVTPLVGILDYTEGIYYGDTNVDHAVAQRNQHNYLLDEVGAQKGFRLLEIGCGLGTLLEIAKERGVLGIGITISEDQVKKCVAKGLDARLMNYKSISKEWYGKFDGIIANGSLEHFCQPEDAIQGKQNDIYKEMFSIFSKVLDPKSQYRKVTTTAIHFQNSHINPEKFLKHPLLQIFDREGFHASILHRGYGGYYPIKQQLANCASGIFQLQKEINGTEDYRITSEYWCNMYKKALFTNHKFMLEVCKYFLKKPSHTIWTIASYVGPESWPWQFRGKNPPTHLYRQTWQMI